MPRASRGALDVCCTDCGLHKITQHCPGRASEPCIALAERVSHALVCHAVAASKEAAHEAALRLITPNVAALDRAFPPCTPSLRPHGGIAIGAPLRSRSVIATAGDTLHNQLAFLLRVKEGL